MWNKLVVMLVLAMGARAQNYTVSTIAGGGPSGGDGGAATATQLVQPTNTAIDSNGNLYIADSGDCVVRKVAAGTGIITRFAGNGTCGSSGDNLSATSAQLRRPTGVAVDANGTVYIADSLDHRVRKVSSGIITTFAGTGVAGYNGDSISATSALLNAPWAVAVDVAGNVYIADSGNNRIREVSAGIITTVAGNGSAAYNGDNILATQASLNLPTGVAVSGNNVYIADNYNCRIRVVSGGGTITTFAGTGVRDYNGDQIAATSADLYYPSSVAVDSSGSVYVTDSSNVRIRKITGGLITTAGGTGATGFSGDGGPATSATFNVPYGIAVDPSGNLYVSDIYNGRIRKLTFSVVNSSTALTASANPTNYGQPLTLTATVSPATAGGTVTFMDGAASIGTATLNGGIATYVVSTLALGLHSLTAVYGGDINDTGSTSAALTLKVVSATSTTLVSSVNPAVAGQSVTLTANVSPSTATGIVTFRDGSATLGTAALNAGVAFLTQTFTSVGAHSLTAVYAGDSGDSGSTSLVYTQNVTAAALADLVITSLTGPTAGSAGGFVNVNLTVLNQGVGAAGPFIVEFYYSPTPAISTTMSVDTGYSCSFSGLAAGGSSNCTGTIMIPNLANGTYYLGAIADANNQVVESNKTNNSRVSDSGPVVLTTSATYSISGKITLGANPVGGVTVALGSQSGTSITDASGNYNFSGLPAGGSFTVTPTLAGYAFSPASQTVNNLTANQIFNFSAMAAANTVIVSGQVTVSGAAQTGVTVTVNGSQTVSTTSDSSGRYSFALPQNGAYTLSAALLGFSFSGPVNLGTITTNQTVNFSGVAVAGLEFYPITPCRVADTRAAAKFSGAFGAPSMTPGSTRSFPIPSSACGIPGTAAAYSLNITAVPAGYLGYLSVFPTGQATPVVSTLNSYSGNPVANAAIVPAGTGGAISIYVTDATDVLFDINGYFAAPQSSGLAFYPVTPCRIADTRAGGGKSGQFGAPSMTANSTRTFTVPASTCNIPTTAAAYALNFTVVPQGYLGYLTTWPAGLPEPVVSTLNSYTGTVVANAALVPGGINGAIDVFVTDPTDVLFDVNGYFAPLQTSGLKFYPVAPCRIADTRAGGGKAAPFGPPMMAAGTQRTFPIASSTCGIPSGASAYSLNFTAVPQGYLGYLTTWPTGQAIPAVSTLNSYTGTAVANAAIVPAGTNGAISVYVTDATDVVFDINGYFAP